jgi:hypothetical protein
MKATTNATARAKTPKAAQKADRGDAINTMIACVAANSDYGLFYPKNVAAIS